MISLNKYSRQKKSIFNIKTITIGIIISIALSSIVYLFARSAVVSLVLLVLAFIFYVAFNYFADKLKKADRIHKIESVFPDFLQLMSSNLRAGMTIDRAMLLSARPEFSPLDDEILQTGRDITTGKSIEDSLESMAVRIDSDKIHKTILLVISGIRAGGNIAILLEETAVNMRERDFVEKKSASNVMMYVIFIFAAISIFAPALFSLSNVLVGTMTNMLGGVSPVEMPTNLPFSFTSVNISQKFVLYYSLIFIFVLDCLASIVLGLVSKGEEKQGLKFLIPILFISFSVFLIMKFVLEKFLANL